jgi:ribose-phosphate pyrophosphokinase
MKPLLFELSAAPGLCQAIGEHLGCDVGRLSRRNFPDGETYLRFLTPVRGRTVMLLCTLDHPDPKLSPLLFAAEAAREQGASAVGLIAPYLAYMRQDKAFNDGEAVTSETFAAVLSHYFDWLLTVDPHLHRHKNLNELYSIPAAAVTSTDAVADWIAAEVDRPLIVGPDEESRQWVERIAEASGASATVLRKERRGDYSVSIDGHALAASRDGTVVIVDDIASSARTMIEAVRLVRNDGYSEPVCVVVHPIFAGSALEELHEAGAARVVSTNTIAHPSNAIDISTTIAKAAGALMKPAD